MGKKRRERKVKKMERKNGRNPVTGEVLSKKDAKKGRKFGFNEDGTSNSKKQNKQVRKLANKERMQTRADSKAESRINRTSGRRAKKEGIGSKKASEGFATEELANQGIDSQTAQKEAVGNAISGSISSVTDMVGSIYGGGGSSDDFYDDFSDDTSSDIYKNFTDDSMSGGKDTSSAMKMSMPMILGVVGALLYFITKK